MYFLHETFDAQQQSDFCVCVQGLKGSYGPTGLQGNRGSAGPAGLAGGPGLPGQGM